MLSEKDLEVISKAAATAVIEHLESEKKKQRDSRLRNMKLLLRNYRSFVKHCADIEIEISKIDETIDQTLLESDEITLLSIKKSKKKTLAMVEYINKMLAVYETMCEQSDKVEENRRYDVIYHMYIAKKKKTSIEISEMHHVAVRTVFGDIEKACKDLSVLVFGIDGIEYAD